MPRQVSGEQGVKRELVKLKDCRSRQFKVFANNFYVLKSAIRYFAVKKQMSFTSAKLAKDFPIPVSVAGSGLKVLEELGALEQRTDSSSSSRYMPGQVDMDVLQQVEQVLVENYEIEDFTG